MSRKNKRVLRRLGLSVLLLAAGLVLRRVWQTETAGYVALGLFLAAWAAAGYDVVWSALRGILRGRLLDESFLMTAATVGALALGEYPEAVAVMVFYQIGEVVSRYAVGKTRRSVAALNEIRPDCADVVEGDTVTSVACEEVPVGAVVRVKPGAYVPLDGVVEEGESAVNTAALTGESLPRDVGPGDTVAAGCVNETGLLTLRVTKPFEQSTVARILEMTETAAEKKAPAERFITKFARVYTPAVVGAAVLLCLIPTLVGGDFAHWLRRSLLLLMVSCPCALVISVPLGFFGGIGAMARRGVLVKGSDFTDVLSRIDTAVFDKTGTLTQGRFVVKNVFVTGNMTEDGLLALAAAVERGSSHPLAVGVAEAASVKGLALPEVKDVKETPGRGVMAKVGEKTVEVGGDRLLADAGLPVPEANGAAVHVLCDGMLCGTIVLTDEVKPEAADVLNELRSLGVKKTVMLTGDRREAAAPVAKAAGVDEVAAGLLPEDKVSRVEALLHDGGRVLYVGDGINDAPVLARADVGVAMGAMGSDAAMEAADVVLMNDRLAGLCDAIRLSRRTMRIVRENIVFSLAVKFAVLICAAAIPGMSMAVAIFADVGVMVLAVLNSLRALR